MKNILRNMPFTSRSLPRIVFVIAAARAVSLLGDEVAIIAWLFRAKSELGHWGVAAVLAAGATPLVLLAPVAGLLVDRVRARRLLFTVTLVQVLVAVALAFAGESTFIVLIALLAAATCVVGPTWQALIPTLVRDDQLPSAMGMMQTTYAAAGMLGPFIGGLLFAEVGFRSVLFIDAGSFLVLVLIPLFSPHDRLAVRDAAHGAHDSMWSGITHVAKSPALRSLVILLTMLILTLGIVNVVEIFFTTTVLRAGPRGYGLLGLCFGFGMLVAAACASTLSRRFPSAERIFVASCVALTVVLALFALSGNIFEAAAALMVLGAANALLNVQVSVLLVRATGHVEHLRGRIFAAVTGTVSAAQILSIALGGVLLSVWDPRTIILLGSLAAGVALVATVRPVLRATPPNPVIAVADAA